MSTSTRATGHSRTAHVLHLRSGALSPDRLQEMAAALNLGALAIFPTETVYGLGTSAFALGGIRRIYQLKGRTWKKPLALLVPSLAAARPLVDEIPAEAVHLAEAFWPGPLTLVLRASILGQCVTGGLERIAIRVPDHPMAQALLKAVRVPLATTSVNRSGQDPATSGEQAVRLFGSQVDWVVDGGVCAVRSASSIVDVSHHPFTVIREGALSKKKLEAVLFHR